MRIMDKFNCQYCNKEVILESGSDLVDVDRYEIDCACRECYNKISIPKMDYKYATESEWYDIQGKYLG